MNVSTKKMRELKSGDHFRNFFGECFEVRTVGRIYEKKGDVERIQIYFRNRLKKHFHMDFIADQTVEVVS